MGHPRRRAGRGRLQEGRRPDQIQASSAVSPSSLVVSPPVDLSADGATIVAMVKSRSVIALSLPLGSLTWLMWIESPTSKPVTSIEMSSGMLAASHTSSSS
eukprot:c35967_g1_i1.p1 GENE.c35967_g1_i1~~c35967_g1_i1.p1  ORF type:complete len:101 (-),score=10.38 c35967_g1_i1:54-356(-)